MRLLAIAALTAFILMTAGCGNKANESVQKITPQTEQMRRDKKGD